MRFSRLFLTAAAAASAALAAAQGTETQEAPDPPEAQEEAREPRLGDLDRMVDQLLAEEARPAADAADPEGSEAPAPGQAESTDEPAAAEGAEAADEAAETAAVQDGQAEAEAPEESAEPAAQTPPSPPPPLSGDQLAELERAAERGRLLIAITRAGIIATQDMLSRVSDPEGAGIAGWIAEPAGNGMSVTFYGDGEGDPHAVYRTTLLGGRVVSRDVFLTGDRPPLNPRQARMAAARAATLALERSPCGSDQFNYLIVPPDGVDAPVTVYQITPQTERGRFPLGGHYRTVVAADGTVVETRGFTNACLDVEVTPAAEGQPPRPIAVTHLLDPLPTEVHVLAAALMGRPLVVISGDPQRLFGVTAEAIAELRR